MFFIPIFERYSNISSSRINQINYLSKKNTLLYIRQTPFIIQNGQENYPPCQNANLISNNMPMSCFSHLDEYFEIDEIVDIIIL